MRYQYRFWKLVVQAFKNAINIYFWTFGCKRKRCWKWSILGTKWPNLHNVRSNKKWLNLAILSRISPPLWSKNRAFSKKQSFFWVFWSYILIQDTPNFKGFLMAYILFTNSKLLVWVKTGLDLASFRGNLNRSIFSKWKYFWKQEKIFYIPSNFHIFCFIPWYFFSIFNIFSKVLSAYLKTLNHLS